MFPTDPSVELAPSATNRVIDSTNEPPSQKKPSVSPKHEFFDYLAYHGVKNQKAMELEKLKAAEELAGCTFKPQLVSKNPSAATPSVGKKAKPPTVSSYKKDHSKYEAQK